MDTRVFNELRAWALAQRLWEQQQELPAEYSRVVDKRFWGLF